MGSFAAYNLNYTETKLSSSMLNVKLLPMVGAPSISGPENYVMVPVDLSTVLEQRKKKTFTSKIQS